MLGKYIRLVKKKYLHVYFKILSYIQSYIFNKNVDVYITALKCQEKQNGQLNNDYAEKQVNNILIALKIKSFALGKKCYNICIDSNT